MECSNELLAYLAVQYPTVALISVHYEICSIKNSGGVLHIHCLKFCDVCFGAIDRYHIITQGEGKLWNFNLD